ncbi:hypothetical protein GCM10011492_06650 [Flexivirga endophytica]|uniref:4Fe-4S Wbl-type domain-containing protein n=1 Tax=Flexivirga endophytica TaxID=1849103 RepID=A0A916WPZ7_9MICO|nr:WhiB family transcriptional regulator [Flexivirga endophytica]GGB19482.1 hypothetical protein GCM10011492_06650 [Flexivirga endophytica]GHB36219.1 hypothetical protein GCM10008112_00960 [Flexivirga endophytica]
MTTAEDMHFALLALTDRNERPPCGDKATAHLWTSDEAADRDLAIPLCAGCPIAELCGEYAAEVKATHGVFGGTDFSTNSPTKRRTA